MMKLGINGGSNFVITDNNETIVSKDIANIIKDNIIENDEENKEIQIKIED